MDLMGKIENIREKPEHIRRRYVLFFVSISMVFIIAIWFVSFGGDAGIVQSSKINQSEDLRDITNQFNSQKESMRATVDGVKNVIENGAKNKMQDDNLNRQNESATSIWSDSESSR